MLHFLFYPKRSPPIPSHRLLLLVKDVFIIFYQISCLFDLMLQAGRRLPRGVGLNVVAHVPPLNAKKAHGLQFTVPCAFTLLF